jgi:hypothetical protein
MQGDDRNDQFDDLFEPFDLVDAPSESTGELPPASEQPAPPAATTGEIPVSQQHVTTAGQDVATVSCPSCGAVNPSFNHHCERCGSRLSSDPMPIASAPPARSTAGGRALGVLAAVVLVVALVALMMNIFGGSDGSEVAVPGDSTSTTTTSILMPPTELVPTSVKASSELNESFSAENLIDGDPDTRWNDNSLRGVGAELEFTFSPAVQITEIVFQNVEDDEAFKRNYKIQGYQIEVNDLNVPISGRLLNSNEPQRVMIASLETFNLKIFITTTHLAEPVGQAPPFSELALQGIQFFGFEK